MSNQNLIIRIINGKKATRREYPLPEAASSYQVSPAQSGLSHPLVLKRTSASLTRPQFEVSAENQDSTSTFWLPRAPYDGYLTIIHGANNVGGKLVCFSSLNYTPAELRQNFLKLMHQEEQHAYA